MNENWTYHRGDVYLANLDPHFGSEQGGTRPVLVLQNNTGNFFCPTLIVAPLTSNLGKKPNQPTHHFTDGDGASIRPSVVMLEQITTIDKRRIKKFLGNLSREEMDDINGVIEISLGLYIPEEIEAP